MTRRGRDTSFCTVATWGEVQVVVVVVVVTSASMAVSLNLVSWGVGSLVTVMEGGSCADHRGSHLESPLEGLLHAPQTVCSAELGRVSASAYRCHAGHSPRLG